MKKLQIVYVVLSTALIQAVQAADGSSSEPFNPNWRTAGLLVGTVHNERLDREMDQWLPFDWTWNLIIEEGEIEDGIDQSQQYLDELWAIVDASDHSTQPLSKSFRDQYQEQLRYLDPDLDRSFDLCVWIRNGLEVIRVPKVVYERGNMSWGFPHYDSVIEMAVSYNPLLDAFDRIDLEGEWRKPRGDNVERVRFRSSEISKPHVAFFENDALVAGFFVDPVFDSEFGIHRESRWAMELSQSGESIANLTWYNCDPNTMFVGSTHREPIQATVLTPTGDFRFLSGYQQSVFGLCGNDESIDEFPPSLYFSCFDGAHAFLFTAVMSKEQTLSGDFWSGNWHHETWTAVRDDDAELPDAFGQTSVADAGALEDMVFKNLEGQPTRVLDVLDASNANARIIEIFGTWCPNCSDAGRELVSLRAKYGDDLAVVGLAFEITDDFDRSVQQVQRHHEHIGTDWPILIAGLSDKDKASAALPVLDKVRSYPTLIFLDRHNEVQGVYSGFSGPATGDAYIEQRERFEALIDTMIAD